MLLKDLHRIIQKDKVNVRMIKRNNEYCLGGKLYALIRLRVTRDNI